MVFSIKKILRFHYSWLNAITSTDFKTLGLLFFSETANKIEKHMLTLLKFNPLYLEHANVGNLNLPS